MDCRVKPGNDSLNLAPMGLDPAIYLFRKSQCEARWMRGSSPRMTSRLCAACYYSGSAQAGTASGLGVKRIELVLRQRPFSPSELDRDIVKPARREAAIEMPQSRNDHPDDRDLDIGARLIEDEEIEALAPGEVDAGGHLLARVETAELRAEVRPDDRSAARRQIGMVLQPKRRGRPVLVRFSIRFLARWVLVPGAHETDGQKLIELGHRAQHGDPRIEVRAGPELDEFLRVLHPVRQRH